MNLYEIDFLITKKKYSKSTLFVSHLRKYTKQKTILSV